MGENGAGKSTLMKIVAGMLQKDGGEMLWQGRPVSFARPAEASANRDRHGAPGVVAGAAFHRRRKHLSWAREDSTLGWVNRRSIMERAARADRRSIISRWSAVASEADSRRASRWSRSAVPSRTDRAC